MHDEDEVHFAERQARGRVPNPDWLTLNSVGIDIGSSTSHLTFSRLTLQRKAIELTSRWEVVDREILYRSSILLTPFRDTETIDMEPLCAFITRSYREAGIDPSEMDTGAVICTGEAVRKKNAEAITRFLSSQGGKFVCATAGPRLEGVLAAHGSGSVAHSRHHQNTLMNVDLGGGTTKVTLVRKGTVIETGAINVGARLVSWDSRGHLVRIEESGRKIARSIGLSLELGQPLSNEQRRRLAQKLADLLFEYLRRGDLSPLASELLVTEPLTYQGPVEHILFSGGVSEYVYGHDTRDYGDLGPIFGEEIQKRLQGLGTLLEEGSEQIRATVIGASQYTIQLSSSTIFVSRRDVLPIRDRQVVVPHFEPNHLTPESVAQAIHQALERQDLLEAETRHRPIALFVRWPVQLSYHSLHTLASGIAAAMATRDDDPWVLACHEDIGALLGTLLKEELGVKAEVVATDEIEVGDLDFIDIGAEVKYSQAVPVVVKSLTFG